LPDIILVECLDCGKHSTYHTLDTQCPHCGSEWRQAVYDYASLGERLPGLLERRPFDMWRYRELLPLKGFNPSLSMGEGGTPLIHAPNLGLMLGCPNIYIKDERQGPTNSFKDRQAAIGIAALKEAGVTEAVLASTGNVAIAYSAHAARAGIKLWAFVTSLVPAEKMREVAIYGTQVVKVTGTYDQAKKLAAEFARQRGYYLERGPRTIPSVEGMKTIAFEIAEQLSAGFFPAAGFSPAAMPAETNKNGRLHSKPSHTPAAWRVPDWYFQSVSGGLGPLGVQKGFHELMLMGLTRRMPGMAIIQAEGCSPMVKAWEQNLDVAEPVLDPRTHIATLATGDPGRTYTLLRQRIQQSGGEGLFAAVSDEETFRTIHILAKMEGVSVEPAAAVAFAGLIRLARLGKINPSDTIVVNCTGHTLPVETSILGDGWARSVEVAPVYTSTMPASTVFAAPLPASPQEGLLSALNQITAERFPRIAIVDDTPDARRLIRRILQSTGDYTIFEATNGREAIELVRQELPDLIILDLMMPEVDGFTVLDELKSQPETASIPVIVVTAKSLTADENRRLRGQIHSLMQKGEFLSDELLEEIQSGVNNAGVAAGIAATGAPTDPSGASSTSR
jgi:threonine synthase